MRVSIIGAGYVGLVSGACFAEMGHDVACVDIDDAKVAQINAGRSPLHEAGLEELIRRNIGRTLRATQDLHEAVVESDLTIIAVPTPFDPVSAAIDLKFVVAAAEQVGRALAVKDAYHVVVVKSTVVPGTTDTVVKSAIERASGKQVGRDIGLGVCPEFLSEGTAVNDFMKSDRIVLGGDDAETLGALVKLHQPFENVPTLHVNCRTAEMIKYASNAFLATCISFANELAGLCSALGGLDMTDVTRGMIASRYLRNGASGTAPIAGFLSAGCGFGGSCLPKDVAALAAHGRAHGVSMPLLDSVLSVNRGQALRTVELLRRHVPDLRGKVIAVLGTAFKPETADLRTSPAEPIIELLKRGGAIVRTHDPAANEDTRRQFGNTIDVCDRIEDAIDGAAGIIVVTAWKQFGVLPSLIAHLSNPPAVVDGRRMFNPSDFAIYEGIGRSEPQVDLAEQGAGR